MKMFFMIIIIMGAYLAGNIYIFIRLMQTLSGMALGVRIAASVTFWILALLLLISMFMRDIPIPTTIAKGLFSIGSVWLVFTLYMVLALLIFDIAKRFGYNKFIYKWNKKVHKQYCKRNNFHTRRFS